MSNPTWRKSSHSGTEQQTVCVEVAGLRPGVGIRDSKNPHLGHLTLPTQVFADLLARAKRDELNL
ncbi:DUF397 domain-containing protein [Actinomadura rubrisoli]|uniref:DUF397 domain-containing protein n=1 Tax=Actinomadura rubrisoli TaxID=2530368 RepID=A0A4R4ZWC7_9ACTN|nr:DUF397 domain-containing protein [Actinomadura rubrisoli]TDD63568.1 DUF397 domain-containing protein [Actinomadura rubrisoli]